MRIDLAFFDEDLLLARGSIHCVSRENTITLEGEAGYTFNITYQFEEPACPIFIECFSADKNMYKVALRFGVHSSEDWETINLGDIHTLAFKCYE